MSHVLVVAKAPVAGRVKTRLCPPLDPIEAAEVAEAALADTLEAAGACGATRRVLALEGEPGDWLPVGWQVIPQVAGGLGDRLGAAWTIAGGPGVQIGMDTPQVTASLLDSALTCLDRVDAALGLAPDGGWWAIALRQPDPRIFAGVPMSHPWTGRAQLARLRRLDLRVEMLPELDDIDTHDDLRRVAALASGTRTALLSQGLDQMVPAGR